MAKKSRKIDEKALTKGELRKLNALRKSIGPDLGDDAFSRWHAKQEKPQAAEDPNVELIAAALEPLMDQVRIPRGGAYAVRRGRGRFIVEPVQLKD